MRLALAGLLLVAWIAGCASAPMRGRLSAAQAALAAARTQIGVPYRDGGKAPSQGFDCSGLVGWAFRNQGLKLAWGTQALWKTGREVSRANLRPGDLVFFDIRGDSVSHVGIYAGNDRMVHAPSRGGRVREESIAISYWAKRFVGARRVDERNGGRARRRGRGPGAAARCCLDARGV